MGVVASQAHGGGGTMIKTADPFVELRRTRDASGQVLCAWEYVCTAVGIERAAANEREAALRTEIQRLLMVAREDSLLVDKFRAREVSLQQQIYELSSESDAWERRFRDYAGIIGEPR